MAQSVGARSRYGLIAHDVRSLHAGTYAKGRYRRGVRAWRSRNRILFAACFGPLVLLGVAGLIVNGHIVAWAAGAIFGLGAGVWIAMRESPPGYIENWQTGAEGERKTEKALKPLDESQWLVVHDVACRRGNYDHIVVGLAGVFLLDSKNLQGSVHMRGGKPYLRRRSDPEANAACQWICTMALAGAASLHEEIKRRTGHRVWVQAVVVLWSEFDEGVYQDEKCVLVHGSRVHEWIDSQPDTFDEQTVGELSAGVLSIAADPATAASRTR